MRYIYQFLNVYCISFFAKIPKMVELYLGNHNPKPCKFLSTFVRLQLWGLLDNLCHLRRRWKCEFELMVQLIPVLVAESNWIILNFPKSFSNQHHSKNQMFKYIFIIVLLILTFFFCILSKLFDQP